jgi:hypothetical protein
MTKKDEKDADRPRYYSQFWLDVAAGRRVIGAPKPEDGADLADADLPEPTPLARKGGRVNANILPADGYRETRAPAAVADEAYDEDDEFTEPEDEEPDLVTEVDDEDIPTIVDDTPEVLIPDIEPEPLAEEEELDEDEELFEDEDEEEDEDEWPARGRKKPKPGRQVKAPKPPVKKPPRRSRGF